MDENYITIIPTHGNTTVIFNDGAMGGDKKKLCPTHLLILSKQEQGIKRNQTPGKTRLSQIWNMDHLVNLLVTLLTDSM